MNVPAARLRGTVMVQGTTSDAGKSTLVAGLCRLLRRAGVNVAPFKPQNMALNSAVTVDGGEIGRAQALQAQAAGIEPHTDMNPVLLKPTSDTRAQVVIHGHARLELSARDYHEYKTIALGAVMESYERLRLRHDVVVVEGAGSPAEVNLRERDIANMGFATAADCPVVLIADIDRGGVFAHLVGTLDCLSAPERDRVRGFVINRFRGDPALLAPGLDWLAQRTGKPVFGVLPYLHGTAPRRRGCHPDPAGRGRSRRPPPEGGRARVPAHQQPHGFRRAAGPSAGRRDLRGPRHGDPARGPRRSCPAARTCRPTWSGCARRAGTPPSCGTCATAES